MTAFLTSFRFLAGAIAGLLGSEAIEDALSPSDDTPKQSNFSRIAIAITTGIVVAIFIEFLKKRKIL
tara:strand:+ start:97 stop:297 length:201 start_codon:yes stop_codon:yes gene_type:complete